MTGVQTCALPISVHVEPTDERQPTGLRTFGASQRRTVTMKQVALAAEVSSSTVSRVLSGAPSRVPITEETRQRVLSLPLVIWANDRRDRLIRIPLDRVTGRRLAVPPAS